MKPNQTNATTVAILVIGSFVTVAALVRGGGSIASLFSGFTVWALVPYGILFASSSLARTSGRALATLIVSSLATAFAVLIYFDAMFVSTSSTSALVFVFIPLYQLIVAAILFAVIFFTRTRNERSA
jgi:hypothetical protein